MSDIGNNEVVVGIRDFILGGTAEFTILQDAVKDKPSYCVKYKVVRNDNGTCWFVHTEVTNGSDLVSNGKNLIYQGYLKKDKTFHVGKKGKQDYNQKAIKGLLWVLTHSDNMPSIVHVYHHGKCSRCGRKLTDVESLKCGLGPTCRKKLSV